MSIFKKHSRKEVIRAIESHEVDAFKDVDGWPYIFTVKESATEPSSAFGPRQITYSSLENAVDKYLKGGGKLSEDEQEYYTKLVAQGKNKVNLDQGASKFYNEQGIATAREATREDRNTFGGLKVGNIDRADHEKHYEKFADIVFDEKVREAKALGVTDHNGLLRVYHGSTRPESNLKYQDAVNELLENPEKMGKKPGMLGLGFGVRTPFGFIGFNEGGDVSMQKQMELFNEGGLIDEGGTTDPVSGNDVPVGSLQKEVRDDIPAQLSEGEFVMPADVVRYHGLDKMMALRDEAKAGLARMEAMGQMGNADEATIPAGVPFNIDDLIMDNEPVEMQVGGFIQPTGFAQIQQTAPIQQRFASPYAILPPPEQTQTPLTAEQLVPRVETEFRTYVNAQGQTLQIPFINGQPVYPIPPGYTLQSITGPQAPVQEPAVAPAPPQESRDDDPSDTQDTPQGGVAVFGGTVSDGRIIGATKYDLSYGSSGETMPGLLGALTGRFDRVTLTRRDGKKATMSKDLYDRLKEDRTGAETTEIINQLFNYTDAANQQINQSAGLERGFLGFGGNRKELENDAARAIYEDLGLEYTNQPLSEALMVQAETLRERAATVQPRVASPAADIDFEGVVAGEAARIAEQGFPARTADGIGIGEQPSAVVKRVPFDQLPSVVAARAKQMQPVDSPTVPFSTATTVNLNPFSGYDKEFALLNPEKPADPDSYALINDEYLNTRGSQAQINNSVGRAPNLAELRQITAGRVEITTGEDDAGRISLPTPKPSPILRDPAYREDAVDEQVMGRDDRRGQRDTRTSFEVEADAQREFSPSLTPAEIEAQADRDFSNQLVREEQNRQAEIERERFEREERRVAAEAERRNQEEQEENVRQGRSNIVTDSSGRPVTSRGGRAVTTSRGSALRESGAAGDAAIERQADALRKDADDRERAEESRRSEQRVQEKIASGVDPEAAAFESGDNDEPSGGTYCCTASWKRNQMTITEIKELRRWHRQQSNMWQEGYDIWGKWVADNLVAKSDWSASVVKDVYEAFINKKYTVKGLIGLSVIIPGVYATAIYRRMRNYGRVTCTN